MPPGPSSSVKLLNGVSKGDDSRLHDVHSPYFPPLQIVWRNVAIFAYLHVAGTLGLYFLLSGQVGWRTLLWSLLWIYIPGFGITAGAHRLWAHKSYKANLPLRILLTFCQTVALQNSVHEWSRDHRLHHKYTETHADPHNAKRGFFFAHMGWLMVRKHPCVKEKGRTIDMSDLESDPVVMFQKWHYLPLAITSCFLIPGLVPWYAWGENFLISWCFAGVFRYIFGLHGTWLVNSAAHLWGSRPYDKTINPAENKFVSALALGEGWHNYHHTFPWDYKTSEFGDYQLNLTAAFIDFFAWIGWAYDLKTVSYKVIEDRVGRTGDGSHLFFRTAEETEEECIKKEDKDSHLPPAYWGDADIPIEDLESTQVLYPELDKTN